MYEFSLSYQETTWTWYKSSSIWVTIVWVASNSEPFVIPIMSETSYTTDTRFGKADEHIKRFEEIKKIK